MSTSERMELYEIADEVLVQSVQPAHGRGKAYKHTCLKSTLEEVAHAIDAFGTCAFTMQDVQAKVDLPWTQVAVAWAFLRERGCIIGSSMRRHIGATGDVHLDAMVEWHALREKDSTS